MKNLPIYGNDELYDKPDRGGFIMEGKAYRPSTYTVWVNTSTGVATIDYTLVALVKVPVDQSDWSDVVLTDTLSGKFVYRIADGYSCAWINECILEDLIIQHAMGDLVSPIKPRERDLKSGLIPRIGTRLVLGIKRDYSIQTPDYPVLLTDVTLYGTSGNLLIEDHEFWKLPQVEIIEDYDDVNYDWIDDNVRHPSDTKGSCPM